MTRAKRTRASREELRRLSVRARLAREEERSRLARDLHDELGQALTGLKMDLAWLDARLTECAEETALALRGKITAMSQAVDATIQSVRRISTELRPAVLDRLGLLAALGSLRSNGRRRTSSAERASGVDSVPGWQSSSCRRAMPPI